MGFRSGRFCDFTKCSAAILKDEDVKYFIINPDTIEMDVKGKPVLDADKNPVPVKSEFHTVKCARNWLLLDAADEGEGEGEEQESEATEPVAA